MELIPECVPDGFRTIFRPGMNNNAVLSNCLEITEVKFKLHVLRYKSNTRLMTQKQDVPLKTQHKNNHVLRYKN
jgi:hypothetical protein